MSFTAGFLYSVQDRECLITSQATCIHMICIFKSTAFFEDNDSTVFFDWKGIACSCTTLMHVKLSISIEDNYKIKGAVWRGT